MTDENIIRWSVHMVTYPKLFNLNFNNNVYSLRYSASNKVSVWLKYDDTWIGNYPLTAFPKNLILNNFTIYSLFFA